MLALFSPELNREETNGRPGALVLFSAAHASSSSLPWGALVVTEGEASSGSLGPSGFAVVPPLFAFLCREDHLCFCCCSDVSRPHLSWWLISTWPPLPFCVK